MLIYLIFNGNSVYIHRLLPDIDIDIEPGKLFLGYFFCHAAAGLEAGSALVSLTVHKKDLISIFAHLSGHCLF